MVYLSLLLALAAAIGGGLSFEASSALPGDPLYAYKLEVNERVEDMLAYTSAAKAKLHLALLSGRLAEARELAVHGRLDASAQTTITEQVTAEVKQVTAILDALNAQGARREAAAVALQLYATLNDEAARIADASAQGSTSMQISLAPILVRVRTSLSTVALISTKIEAQAAGVVPVAQAQAPQTFGDTADVQL